MENIDRNISLANLLHFVEENIGKLRERLRSEAEKVLPEIPQIGGIVSGNIYIESVGSIIEFDDYGNFEFLYTPDGLTLRNSDLVESEKAREKVFNDIAQQFPKHSRILNVGAGGDTTLPICMEKSGHEVVSTDLAQNTINNFAKRISSSVFACDLFYINEILSNNTFDFILGNSTLGYVDPKKLNKVIKNLSGLIKHGGVFTFDLTPHPIYFQVQKQNQKQTVVNESDIDPTKLLEFVEKYGNSNGINAMAYYSYYRGIYTNIAVLFLIKELYEKQGLSCVASFQRLSLKSGSIKIQLSLRVSKGYPQILNFIENEIELNEKTILGVVDDERIWYRLALIDRHNGELLARKFGIHKNKKEDPWNVAYFINENLSAKVLPTEIKNEVLQGIDPWKLTKIIKPFLSGEKIPKQEPLPFEISIDQVMHKMVIDGTTPMSPEEADVKIDSAYRKADVRKQHKELKKQQKKRKQILKNKRKHGRKRKDRQ